MESFRPTRTLDQASRLEHLEHGLERWSKVVLDLHERVMRMEQLLLNQRLTTVERTLWGGETKENIGLLQFVRTELAALKTAAKVSGQ